MCSTSCTVLQYLCAVTLLLNTLLCVCWLYQLCILFTVHHKSTLMWLPLLLQTPSGLPVWLGQLPRSGLHLHTLTNHSLSSDQPWCAVGVCSSGLPLCGPQDVQIHHCLQVHFQVYCRPCIAKCVSVCNCLYHNLKVEYLSLCLCCQANWSFCADPLSSCFDWCCPVWHHIHHFVVRIFWSPVPCPTWGRALSDWAGSSQNRQQLIHCARHSNKLGHQPTGNLVSAPDCSVYTSLY